MPANPMRRWLLLGTCLLALNTQAQTPDTDLWLTDLPSLASWKPGQLVTLQPVNITRRPGYDNQPAFTLDSRSLLYAAEHGEQTDIYRYDLATRKTTQMTNTPESEYSPAPMPDGTGFTVVRVESDTTQQLWWFDWQGDHATVVVPEERLIGYYAWVDTHTVALFVIDDNSRLSVRDLKSRQKVEVASGIGRSLHRIPGTRAASFLQQPFDGAPTLYRYDLASRRVSSLALPLPGSEDCAWNPDGVLLMADSRMLYRWYGGTWLPVADLRAIGAARITRLAVSPDGKYLALVAQ